MTGGPTGPAEAAGVGLCSSGLSDPATDLAGSDLIALTASLEDARSAGFLGPGPVRDQIWRSLAFTAVATLVPGFAIDLGSGGGLPGLVLAFAWKDSKWLLVDSNQRRSRWLQASIERLGIGDRCDVLCERAEVVARGENRYKAELVTARSFGPPGPTAECAAPLLRRGGQLLVSDPPEVAPGRWPDGGLALLGLVMDASVHVTTAAGPVSVSRLVSISACPEAYPRWVGVPAKKPLF